MSGVNAKRLPLVLALIFAATGCGASEMASAPRAAPPSGAVAAEAAPAAQTAENSSRAASGPSTPAQTVGAKTIPTANGAPKKTAEENPDVLIVYDGQVAMMVDDGKVAPTIDRIIDIGESMGGHLAGRHDGTVTVRVPSPRFHEALEKVGALGEITHQSVTAEDVSEEFHDAEVRLQNLKATQKRLQEFLARSANMNDMLTIEHELERISMEIDRIEGRMRFLKDHAAYSTLSIALSPRPKPVAIVVGPPKVVPPPPPRILALHADWLNRLGVTELVSN